MPGWNFDKFAEGIRAMGVGKVPVSGIIPGPQHGTDQLITNFASVNLLNLQRRQDVMDCLVEATRQYGLGSGGTRVIQGVTPAHVDMEQTVAEYLGKEAAISFATGTVANIGFVNAMAGTHQFMQGVAMVNRDVVFVYDRDAHWSLWKAAEGLKFGERLFSFPHNSVEGLEEVLKKLKGKRVVVVIESVYSIDGTVPAMHEMVDVCERYGALTYVDDANGFLVYGPPHRKFHQEYEGMRRATFIMVSMKKAVGLEGGLIAGPKDAIDSFELISGASSFTAGVLAPPRRARRTSPSCWPTRNPRSSTPTSRRWPTSARSCSTPSCRSPTPRPASRPSSSATSASASSSTTPTWRRESAFLPICTPRRDAVAPCSGSS
nr:8-amino-7-oxononanoate synthase [uncultured bacterium]